MADPADTTTIIKVLAAAYPHATIPADTISVYVELLSDIDTNTLRAATLDLISRSRFFPTVAEIREAAYILRRGPQLFAPEAWGLVVRVMAEIGYMGDPQMHLDRRTMDAIRDVGGWKMLCMSENGVADRARFIEAYDTRLRREQREGVTLPQIADLAHRLTTTARPELPNGRGR